MFEFRTAMNIFIDTNILLSFYHLSSDDLEELKKLIVLLQQNKVVLWLPEQTVIEFKRNRANKIADALKKLQEQRLNMQFPQLAKEYEEYLKLKKSLKESDEVFNKLIENIRKDIENQNLKADQIIQELISLAKEIKTSSTIIEKARFRYDIGNPPGKKDSLGDAINWEALLDAIPSGQVLYFISGDKDYTSPLGENLFEPYLADEWKIAKSSEIIFYQRLSSFFKDKFPDIKLASELEKDLLIRELADSPNFAYTHSVISKLRKYAEFSPIQASEIAQASLTNNQVYWILEDEDVNEFLKRIVKDYVSKIESDYLFSLKAVLDSKDKQPDNDSFDGIPFDGISTENDIPF